MTAIVTVLGVLLLPGCTGSSEGGVGSVGSQPGSSASVGSGVSGSDAADDALDQDSRKGTASADAADAVDSSGPWRLADAACAAGMSQYRNNEPSGVAAADALADTVTQLAAIDSVAVSGLVDLLGRRVTLTARSNVAMDRGSLDEVQSLSDRLDANTAEIHAEVPDSAPACRDIAGL